MKDDFDLSKLKRKKSTRINSKAKGGRFERKVADMFNQRFNTKEFCRTPGSGAFATTHSLPDYMQIYGDLITPRDFKFIIECKSGYNKEGVSSLLNINSNLSKMIAQALRDSEKCLKRFLLILGQDRQDPIVITNEDPMNLIYNEPAWALLNYNGRNLYILKLSDLLIFPNTFFLH